MSRFGDALAMLAVLFGAWIAAAGAAELPVTRILPEPALQRGTYDFPYSVCLDGDTLAFGSPFYGGGWWGPGSVALVRRGDDGWDFLTRLRLRHGYDEMLGFSVVIKGRLLVAGAATAHDGRGGVWLFWDTSDAGDWSQTSEGELPLVHAGPSSYLGQMVALDGRALAVASTTELLLLVDISTSGDWSEWRELVVSPEGGWSGGDDISAVAVNGRTIAVGTASTGEDGEKSGAVHLFHDISAAGDWSDVGETVVMPSDAREGLRFGSSITLAGRRLVVGATGRDETTGKRGAFYVFDDASAARDWSELSETRLARSADDDRPSFGGPVAVDGRTLVASSSYYVMLLEDTSAAGDWSGFSETDVTPYTPDGSVPRPMPVAVQAGTAAVADPGDLQDFGSPGELAILERSPEWAVVDRFWGYTIGDISPMGFGTSVALDGETLMVGRPFDDLGKGAAGSVEVYRYEAGQWQYLTDLRQDVAAPGSNFGSELVLRGRDLLVSGKGSSQSGWGNGGVFVLQDVSVAGDWSEQRQTRLVASDTDFLATSSLSVAFDDRTAFVGNLHAVYVLMDESTAGDWSEVRERKVDIPTSRAGIEVAAAGRTLAVMDEATPSGGAIWIVQDLSVAGDWSELRRVRVAAGDATSSSQLGKALEVLSPRLAAAGEPADDHFRGAVYLFRDTSARNDWSQVTETRMIWPREGTSHGFGGALAASGRWLVVGAENDGEAAAISGAAWLFHDTSGAGDWSTWTGAKLVSPNPWSNDGFGATAAADSGWVVVGAPREDTAGVNNGAVYLYQNSVLDIADLAVTVDANPAVGVGQFAVHSAVVVNRGIDEATGLAVSWELPADVPIAAIGGEGWSCGPIASSVSCSRTSLHAGASSSVAVTLAPTRVGQIVTSVEVSAAEVDLGQLDNRSQGLTTVYGTMKASQRDALETFFRATGGEDWSDPGGWLGPDHPCGWRGVGCTADGSEVVEISLPESNLTGRLPADIGRLKSLKRLILSRNRLEGAIPPEIGDCTALEELELDGNNLRGEIPETITQLVNLKSGGAKLSWNALKSDDSDVRDFLSAKRVVWSTSQATPVKLSMGSYSELGPMVAYVRLDSGGSSSSGVHGGVRFEVYERVGDEEHVRPLRLSGGVRKSPHRSETLGPFEPGTTTYLTARAIFYPHDENPFNTVVSELGPVFELTTPDSTERWVAPDGADVGVCIEAGSPCRTIQYAVDQASAGDTVRIAAGVYDESVTISTDLVLVGEGPRFTVVDAGGADWAIRVDHAPKRVLFSGLSLTGASVAGLLATSNVVALDLEARDNDGAGLDVDGYLTIDGSTVAGNADGGVVVKHGQATLTNVTISGNRTTSAESASGLLVSNLSDATLFGCTVVDNVGTRLGGGVVTAYTTDPAVLRNTVVAFNTPTNCGGEGAVSFGANADGDGSCGIDPARGDLTVNDPGLLELADNGGPTRTHALIDGSPLRDAAGVFDVPWTDQRGVRRPQGAAADIGAFELMPEWGDPERFTPRRSGGRAGSDAGAASSSTGAAATVAVGPQRFADVPATSPAYREIATLDALGLDQGCGGVRFCPGGSITRGRLAEMLAAALGGRLPDSARPEAVFADLPAGDPVAATALRLVEAGLMVGCEADLFCPDDSVSRSEAAIALLRAQHGASWVPPEPSGEFRDVLLGDPAASWIEAAVAGGLFGPCEADRFCPDEPVTRAELAVALVRALGLAH